MTAAIHRRRKEIQEPRTRPGRISESYGRKLEAILREAAAVFCSRGYHQASIRDIARATGVSLAGLYYYFASKEELLYLIQRHTFETILAGAQQGITPNQSPEQRLRALIRLHLQFFLDHPNEMKVLTHEEAWLGKAHGREVRAIKRAYYQLCLEQVEALKETCHLRTLNTRLAVLSLFGMMNWIYTWYNPKLDPDAKICAETMGNIFLGGVLGGREAAIHDTRRTPNGRVTKLNGPGSRQSKPSNGTGPLELPVLMRLNSRARRVQG
jgi:TetR/AcrR family transcriptional regulator, cholesterol catabolism regulator